MRRSVSNKDDDEFVTHVERFDSSGKKTAGQPGRKSGCSSLVAKSRVCTYVAHVYLEVPYIRICRWKHILHTILYYHYKECRIYASNKQGIKFRVDIVPHDIVKTIMGEGFEFVVHFL
uniref:Uncharacterized protein n=1 Tax=Daucus carota subsp. sativus TaxID=79200 RepID=A0A161ZRM2_DAUCS